MITATIANSKLKIQYSKLFLNALLLLAVIVAMAIATTRITDTYISIKGAKITNQATCTVALDGTGDYTDIQSCIDALPNGGTVYVKNGTYSITSELVINSNITVVCDGGAKVIAGAPLESLVYAQNEENIKIQGCFFDANSLALRILNLTNVNHWDVSHNRFYNPVEGEEKGQIVLKNSKYGIFSNNLAENLWIINVVDGCSNITLTGNVIWGTEDSCFSIGTAGSTLNKHIIVSGNSCYKNQTSGFGIDIFGNIQDVTVVGNVIRGAKYDGITVQKDGNNNYAPELVTIVGNSIYDSGRYGISIQSSPADVNVSHVSVIGNTIDNSASADIRHQGNNITYIGNVLKSTTKFQPANGYSLASTDSTVLGNVGYTTNVLEGSLTVDTITGATITDGTALLANGNWTGITDLSMTGNLIDANLYESQHVPEGSPVLYLTFDENRTNGETTHDLSYYNNDGQLGSATAGDPAEPVWTTAGKYGGAYEFDGEDDYIQVADDASLNITDGITISAWIKTNDASATQEIIAKDEHFITHATNVYGVVVTSSKIRFGVGNGTTEDEIQTDETISANTWYHVAGTWNPTEICIYLNGKKKCQSSTIDKIQTRATDLFIGKNNDATYPRPFNGTIDEVRIYDRALSEEEIRYLYTSDYKSFVSLVKKDNNNYIKNVNGVDTSNFQSTGNITSGEHVIVAQGNKICLDGYACTKCIYANSTDIIIDPNCS